MDTQTIDNFNAAAIKALIKLARTQETLTADDVLAEVPAATRAGVSTRLMSTVMADSARSGLIAKTDRYRRSTRTSGPLIVWKSQIIKK